MDSLLAGTLILPWRVHCAGVMSSAVVPTKTFRASRKPFRARAKTVRLPAGIAVRLQPGIPFVFTPESFSRSPRNPFRLAPESARDTDARAVGEAGSEASQEGIQCGLDASAGSGRAHHEDE